MVPISPSYARIFAIVLWFLSPVVANDRSFAHHAVAVCVPHVLIGGMAAPYWRYSVVPGLGAGDSSVAIIVIQGKRVHVARRGWRGGRSGRGR